MQTKRNILIIGDIIALAIMTVIGFATHGEVGLSFLARMGAAFFPLLAAWLISARPYGLFDEQAALNPKTLWQILPAMLLAAPLAVILRAALLRSMGQPLFALILGVTNTLALLTWRWFYIRFGRRFIRLPG